MIFIQSFLAFLGWLAVQLAFPAALVLRFVLPLAFLARLERIVALRSTYRALWIVALAEALSGILRAVVELWKPALTRFAEWTFVIDAVDAAFLLAGCVACLIAVRTRPELMVVAFGLGAAGAVASAGAFGNPIQVEMVALELAGWWVAFWGLGQVANRIRGERVHGREPLWRSLEEAGVPSPVSGKELP